MLIYRRVSILYLCRATNTKSFILVFVYSLFNIHDNFFCVFHGNFWKYLSCKCQKHTWAISGFHILFCGRPWYLKLWLYLNKTFKQEFRMEIQLHVRPSLSTREARLHTTAFLTLLMNWDGWGGADRKIKNKGMKKIKYKLDIKAKSSVSTYSKSLRRSHFEIQI